MTERKRAKGETKSADHRPNSREAAAFTKFKKAAAEHAPRLKISKQGKRFEIGPDHRDNSIGLILLMEALGTTDQDFFEGIVKQLVDTTSQQGSISEEKVNFMLSVIKGVKPRDQVEAMLAAQMAAVHASIMTFARRLANVETLPQQDSAERGFNKLTRTFASQMEALKRYRTGGEQKVTVQHVNVSEGGQAIVGNVTQNPLEPAEKASSGKPASLTAPTEQPMEILAKASPYPSQIERKSHK